MYRIKIERKLKELEQFGYKKIYKEITQKK